MYGLGIWLGIILGSSNYNPAHMTPPVTDWILYDGYWRDSKHWSDTQNWKD